MTVTSKQHTQEYRDTELNIVIDEIGPGEGRLDSGGIEIPLKPAGKGGLAQVPASVSYVMMLFIVYVSSSWREQTVM